MSYRKSMRKIAEQNIKHNKGDYAIYFLSLVLSASLFYAFNSFGGQFKTLQINDRLNHLAFMNGLLIFASLLVSVIVAVLMKFASRFLMNKRKKEIGLYSQLGMRKDEIMHLLFIENAFLTISSSVIGLLLGIFLSQFLFIITSKLILQKVQGFTFFFSWQAAIATFVMMGLLLLLLQRKNKKMLKEMSIVELLYKKDTSATFIKQTKPLRAFVLMMILAFLLLVNLKIAYRNMLLQAVISLIIAACMMGILAYLILALYTQKTNIKKHTSDITPMMIRSQSHETRRIWPFSTGILFMGMIIFVLGMLSSYTIGKDLPHMTPFDVEITSFDQQDIVESLRLEGVDVKEYADKWVSYRQYTLNELTKESFFKTIHNNPSPDAFNEFLIIDIDDYNQLLELQGLSPIPLKENEFIFNYNTEDVDEEIKKGAYQSNVEIAHRTYQLKSIETADLYNANGRSDGGTVIINTENVDNLNYHRDYLSFQLKENIDYDQFFTDYLHHSPSNLQFNGKNDIILEIAGTQIGMGYIAMYLGVILILSSAMLLSIKVISYTLSSLKDYQILHRMGVRSDDIFTSIRKQNRFYFLVPLLVGLVASLLAMVAFVFVLGNIPMNIVFKYSMLLFLIIFLAYISYLIVSSKMSVQMIGTNLKRL